MSCFMSYYILKAIAKVKGVNAAIAVLRAYFGGMLEKGATTFWEDFDTDWMNGRGNLDDFPQSGKKDIHGDFGRFCYKGYRHSLCHGWSSGVVAFLFEEIAGIRYNGGNIYEITPCQSIAGKIKVVLPAVGGLLRLTVSDTVEIEEKPYNVILKHK